MLDLICPYDTGLSLKIKSTRAQSINAITWPHPLSKAVKQSLYENGVFKVFQKGDSITEIMTKPGAICVVVSGVLKSQISDINGRVMVLGFYLQGDIVGFDGAAMEKSTYEAVALSTTCLFILPMNDYWQLPEDPIVLSQCHAKLAGQALFEANRRTAIIGHLDSDQKLAYFLLNIAARMHYQNYARNHFNLPMSRVEISQYLFVTAETVSRTLSRFQESGLLVVKRSDIQILNSESLLALLHKHNATTQLTSNYCHFEACHYGSM
ncbi:Crp/Fnr family transcriptional regulator [Alkalimarinus sediminis]|uniref:Crp/Fnr family transcriptional regulator n=1 Tax=Alkalimarinus sediminis TaxID=1632866 RepID=A0A9E8HQW3_9ALTE|nr:Crp/Fnr family transcriptional regulator [Alkalimarinus sediminis]UZW74129.1 Crp/Fnr family transcriptional regulator [Alkalimarinus sediminis]